MNVLAIDIGGSHVKVLATGHSERRRFKSSPDLTARELVGRVLELASGWAYEVVSLGYPGTVGPDGPAEEPGNLGHGWVGFDFTKAFGKPVRVVNDAAMQAIGAYAGGRMLFLGLGTGLGSTLVVDRVVIPLELGDLPYKTGEMLSDRLGKRGLKKYGEADWLRVVREMTGVLGDALKADYVVLGGGNADLVQPLPEGARMGGNEDAFTGGFRLWEDDVEPHDRPPSSAWRVL